METTNFVIALLKIITSIAAAELGIPYCQPVARQQQMLRGYTHQFYRGPKPDHVYRGTGSAYRNGTTGSYLTCAGMCLQEDACKSFNFCQDDRHCELNSAVYAKNMSDLIFWISCLYFDEEYRHEPVAEAHYAFDENLSDSTANNRGGIATGQITYDNGQCGKAAVFNGQSKIDVDDFRSYPWGSRFSVSVWFRRTGSPDTYQGIVNTGYNNLGSWEIRMGKEMSGGHIGGGVVTANSDQTWDYNNLQASFGNWNHVVMTYDGSTLLFYLNNQLQSGSESCCQGDIISKDIPLTIGQAGVGRSVEFFVGLIDEVKIFAKALTAEEVDTLFNSPCEF